MSRGILIVWTDVPPEIETDFNAWYNHEHLPDRIPRMPGFLRGRRYVAVNAEAGAPKYMTWYDLQNAAVMMSDAHTALRKQRTERDRFFVPQFRNTIKGICDVVCEASRDASGAASHLVLQPVTLEATGEHAVTRAALDELLQKIAALSGVVSAVFARRNIEITQASSAKDDRSGDRYLQGVIGVETQGEDPATAVASHLSAQNLAHMGCAPHLLASACVMRLIHSLVSAD